MFTIFTKEVTYCKKNAVNSLKILEVRVHSNSTGETFVTSTKFKKVDRLI